MAFLENLQGKRWLSWAALGVIVLILGYLLWPSPPPAPPPRKVQIQDAKEPKEKLYDLKIGSWQSRVDQDIEATKKQVAEVDKGQQEIKEKVKDIVDMLSEVSKARKDEEEAKSKTRETFKPVSPAGLAEQKAAVGGGITVHRFGEPKGPEPKPSIKPIPQGGKPTTYLPGGSMAQSVLLTGVDAPVGGKPFPVLLALSEAFIAPNSYRVPLRGCFALGKAEGNASSERADIQVVRMSCVLPRGKAFEQEVTGYLVADDGKQGIPGKLVEKQGQKIALAALAGVGSGLARAFGQQEVTNVVTESGAITSTVTGDALRFGLARGAEGAATELQRHFEKQAERLVPVVEIEAGKNVTLIILSGVKVPGLEAAAKTNVRRGID